MCRDKVRIGQSQKGRYARLYYTPACQSPVWVGTGVGVEGDLTLETHKAEGTRNPRRRLGGFSLYPGDMRLKLKKKCPVSREGTEQANRLYVNRASGSRTDGTSLTSEYHTQNGLPTARPRDIVDPVNALRREGAVGQAPKACPCPYSTIGTAGTGMCGRSLAVRHHPSKVSHESSNLFVRSICRRSIVVMHWFRKPEMRVRFPPPAQTFSDRGRLGRVVWTGS